MRVAALAVWCVLGAAGCEQKVEDGDESCEALAEARASLGTQLDELDTIARGVPADAMKYPTRTSEELVRFTEALQAVNASMDQMYDEWEVGCKWPMIEAGDFDGVNEKVYLPHIDLVARQHGAIVAVAEKLEAAGPPEVVGAAATGYLRTADLLVDGLREQILVCQTDFGDQSCRPYKEAVEAHFGKPTLPAGESEPSPDAPSDAETETETETEPEK